MPNIETILQQIGVDRSMERESSRLAKWLVQPFGGTARVHWLVSCAYIACPLSSLLVLVVAMEAWREAEFMVIVWQYGFD